MGLESKQNREKTYGLLTFDSGHCSHHQFVYQQVFPLDGQVLLMEAEISVLKIVSYPFVVKMTAQEVVVRQQYLGFPLEEAYTLRVKNSLLNMKKIQKV